MTVPHQFHPSILREYDIRGVFGETLFTADAYALGRSFATVVREAADPDIDASSEHNLVASALSPRCREDALRISNSNMERAPVAHSISRPCVVVGRDGRLSSPELEQAIVAGLAEGGVDVIRLGISPTPMLYFAEASLPNVYGGIQITGSHNPADHNGFKLVLGHSPYFGDQITRLARICAAGAFASDGPGHVREHDVLPAYLAALLKALSDSELTKVAAMRIGWDAGNGAAGPALERLTSLLPGEHHLLFCEVDGRFPNHHPDPTLDANLVDLRTLVSSKNLDFGLAFDGDADRLGVIDAHGRVLDADTLLAIYARDVLSRRPGAKTIIDVKASRTVFEVIAALGGVAEMAPSGHSHIKSRMKQTGALLGGETSGHFFFAEDWYGFDDGLFAAMRLIAAILRLETSLADLRDAMPQTCSTPELRFPVQESRKFAVIEEVQERLSRAGIGANSLDGVRVDTSDGWWLLRASNTQAALTARAESDTSEGLARLIDQIDAHLAASGVSRK